MDYTKLSFDRKLEILTNSSALNLALDALTRITQTPQHEWHQFISNKAKELTDKLSDSEVEEQIVALEKIRSESEDGQTAILERRLTS